MGYQLRREIRDLLPRGILTDKEARLLLELADNCRDETRTGKPGSEWLAQAADIPDPTRVGEYFASIAEKWVEFRVPLGETKDGRKFYSHPGKRTSFKFPEKAELEAAPAKRVPKKRKKVPEVPGANMAPESLGPSGDMVPEKQGPKVPEVRGAYGPGVSGEWSRSLGDPSPQLIPQEEPSSLSSDEPAPSVTAGSQPEDRERDDPEPPNQFQAFLAEHAGIIDRNRADALIFAADHLMEDGRTKGLGWWKKCAREGDLPAVIALLDGKLDAQPKPAEKKPHRDTHPFKPDPSGTICEQCYLAPNNGRHRPPAGGWDTYDPHANQPTHAMLAAAWNAEPNPREAA